VGLIDILKSFVTSSSKEVDEKVLKGTMVEKHIKATEGLESGNAIKDIIKTTYNAIKDVLGKTLDIGKTVISKPFEIIKSVTNSIADTIPNIIHKAGTFGTGVSAIPSYIISKGTILGTKIAKTASNIIKKGPEVVSNTVNKIVGKKSDASSKDSTSPDKPDNSINP
jgi:hypothetical protein